MSMASGVSVLERASAALQPFVIEATTTKSPSPRYLKELILRATSHPTTFTFTELLYTPAIQSLRGTSEQSALDLLEIYAYGTYDDYAEKQESLLQLSQSQAEKLRLLTLLTVAASSLHSNMLTYTRMLNGTHLASPSELEALAIKAIYNGLMIARFTEKSRTPRMIVTSVAPVRTPHPSSLNSTLSVLSTWSDRCTGTIQTLQSQIDAINALAAQRTQSEQAHQSKIDQSVIDFDEGSVGSRSRRQGNKRDLDDRMDGEFDDEGFDSDGAEPRFMHDEVSERETKGGLKGVISGNRGSKRNRGKGGLFG